LNDYNKFLNAKCKLFSISTHPLFRKNYDVEFEDHGNLESPLKSLNILMEENRDKIHNYADSSFLNKSFPQISSSFEDKNKNNKSYIYSQNPDKYEKSNSIFEKYDKNETYQKNENCERNEVENRMLISKACETSKFNFNAELMLGKVNLNDFAEIKREKSYNNYKKSNNHNPNLFTQYGKNKFLHDKTQFKFNPKKLNQTFIEDKFSAPCLQNIQLKNLPKGLIINLKVNQLKIDKISNFKILGEKIKSPPNPSRICFSKDTSDENPNKKQINKRRKLRINLAV